MAQNTVFVQGKERVLIEAKRKGPNGTEYLYKGVKLTVGTNPITKKPIQQFFRGETAEEIEASIEEKLHTEGTRELYRKRSTDVTIEELAWKFYELSEARWGPNTKANHQYHIRKIVEMGYGSFVVRETTLEMMKLLQNDLLASGLEAPTINACMDFLCNVFEYAKGERIIFSNPCQYVGRIKGKKKEKYALTLTQLKKMCRLYDADELCGDLLGEILALGIRVGEGMGMRWCMVDLDNDVVCIDEHRIRNRADYDKPTDEQLNGTKTREKLTIPLSESAKKYLNRAKEKQERYKAKYGSKYQNEEGYVFTDRLGQPLKYSTVVNHMKKIGEAIGRPELAPHDLRRNAATRLYESTGKIEWVQACLGHNDIRVTMNYILRTETELKQIGGAIDGVFEKIFREEWDDSGLGN